MFYKPVIFCLPLTVDRDYKKTKTIKKILATHAI